MEGMFCDSTPRQLNKLDQMCLQIIDLVDQLPPAVHMDVLDALQALVTKVVTKMRPGCITAVKFMLETQSEEVEDVRSLLGGTEEQEGMPPAVVKQEQDESEGVGDKLGNVGASEILNVRGKAVTNAAVRTCSGITDHTYALTKTENMETERDQKYRDTKWVAKLWSKWRERQNMNAAAKDKIGDLLTMDHEELDTALSKFVTDIRRADGSEYSSRSLQFIMYYLLHHMRKYGVTDMNFLDKFDPRFAGFRKTLQSRMRDLRLKEREQKSREPGPKPTDCKKETEHNQLTNTVDYITSREEEILWKKGEFGSSTSQAMVNTVFFYNCKLFGVHGISNHRGLMCDQFTFHTSADGQTFMEFCTNSFENHSGGRKKRKLVTHRMKHFSTQPSERCVVSVYQKYVKLAGGKGSFYRRPVGDSHLSEDHMGSKRLRAIIKTMCKRAGLIGNFTASPCPRAPSLHLELPSTGVDIQEVMGCDDLENEGDQREI